MGWDMPWYRLTDDFDAPSSHERGWNNAFDNLEREPAG
jgi:hypothetical protein